MWHLKLRAAAVASMLMISACDGGGGGSAGGGGPVAPAYQLTGFSVVGTSADLSDGSAPLNPAVAGGTFTVTTTVPGIHQLQLWVSANDTWSSADLKVYEEYCFPLSDCGATSPFINECFINNSNEFWCADESVKTDISAFLDVIPKSAFVIARTCDASMLNCGTTMAEPVQFQ